VSRFVLDNTVTMAWCFTDEATEFTEALLSRLSNLTDSAIVPALWLYEVVNVTELAVRKRRITAEKADAFLERLPVSITASYLDLAIRHKLPIAASDKALTKAAQAAGVNLVQV